MEKFNFSKSFNYLPLLCAALACATPAAADDAPQQAEIEQQTIAAAQQSTSTNRNAMLFSPEMQFKSAVGTPAYYQEAFELNCQAARNGDARAYYAMGWLYAKGHTGKKDLVVATALFNKAAESGYAKAKEILEVMPRVAEQPAMPACLVKPPEPLVAEGAVSLEFYEKDGEIHRLVSRLAPEYGIDVGLAMAVIAVESGFNPRATSPKNAQGLMQLIPDTARRFQVRDAYDPEQNIKGGLAYLQWLMTEFEGNVEWVAAAYNAGEKAVEKYRGIPPYAETQNYVQKVLALYRKTSHPYRDRFGRVVGLTSP